MEPTALPTSVARALALGLKRQPSHRKNEKTKKSKPLRRKTTEPNLPLGVLPLVAVKSPADRITPGVAHKAAAFQRSIVSRGARYAAPQKYSTTGNTPASNFLSRTRHNSIEHQRRRALLQRQLDRADLLGLGKRTGKLHHLLKPQARDIPMDMPAFAPGEVEEIQKIRKATDNPPATAVPKDDEGSEIDDTPGPEDFPLVPPDTMATLVKDASSDDGIEPGVFIKDDNDDTDDNAKDENAEEDDDIVEEASESELAVAGSAREEEAKARKKAREQKVAGEGVEMAELLADSEDEEDAALERERQRDATDKQRTRGPPMKRRRREGRDADGEGKEKKTTRKEKGRKGAQQNNLI